MGPVSNVFETFQSRQCHFSNEGKRHVKTVPVRIIKAQNILRKYHDDWLFAKATTEFVKQVITLFGPINCFFISR